MAYDSPTPTHSPEASVPDSARAKLSPADLVIAFLSLRSTPCPHCGFDLRGLAQPRCPECATEVTLCVQGAGPRSSAYLVGLVALAMGAGACSLVVLAAVVQTFAMGGGSPRFQVDFDPIHLLVSIAAMPLFGAALAVWIARPRLVDGANGVIRAGVAGACIAATIGLGLVYGLMG